MPRAELRHHFAREITSLKKAFVPALFVGACLFAPLVWAGSQGEDMSIVFRVRGAEGERAATHHYSSTRARFDHGDQATLVDFASGRIVNVSVEKREYWETTFVEIEQAMTSLSAEMEKAMAGIPDGLRKKMMGDADREVTVTKGEIRTVASVPCQRYVVALGEKTRMETCAAASLELPFDRSHLRNLALVTAPIAKGNSGINKMVSRLREIEGFPLASTTVLSLMGKRIEAWAEATEIRRGPIDASTFATPTGFKRVESPFAKMGR
jgi:hypothetical protein